MGVRVEDEARHGQALGGRLDAVRAQGLQQLLHPLIRLCLNQESVNGADDPHPSSRAAKDLRSTRQGFPVERREFTDLNTLTEWHRSCC